LNARSDADSDFVIACNCKACQRRTGAPFGAGLYFPKTVLAFQGVSKTWHRTSDAGRDLGMHFCPECGTTLYWTLEMRPDHIGVAYGCFVTPVPDPIRAIWTEAKHGWVTFPDSWKTFPQGSPV
jgi:hypothetical protein